MLVVALAAVVVAILVLVVVAVRYIRSQDRAEFSEVPGSTAESGRAWESMSDVDYWAELTSDKPLVTAAMSAPREAPAPRRDRHAPPRDRHAPPRDRHAPAAEPNPREYPPAWQHRPAAPVHPSYRVPENYPAPVPQRAHEAVTARPARQAPPAVDDDPLTSPTFPGIGPDGRSYRTGPQRAAADVPVSPPPPWRDGAPPQHPAEPGWPGRTAIGRPAADPYGAGHRYGTDRLPPAAAQRHPSGNPYGSYVSGQPAGSAAGGYHGEPRPPRYAPPRHAPRGASGSTPAGYPGGDPGDDHRYPPATRDGRYPYPAGPVHPYGP
jgi:hypothetical protein